MSRVNYSKDFRMKVTKDYLENKKKISEIVKEHDLHRMTVYRWINEFNTLGAEQCFMSKNGKLGGLERDNALLRARVAELEEQLKKSK